MLMNLTCHTHRDTSVWHIYSLYIFIFMCAVISCGRRLNSCALCAPLYDFDAFGALPPGERVCASVPTSLSPFWHPARSSFSLLLFIFLAVRFMVHFLVLSRSACVLKVKCVFILLSDKQLRLLQRLQAMSANPRDFGILETSAVAVLIPISAECQVLSLSLSPV